MTDSDGDATEIRMDGGKLLAAHVLELCLSSRSHDLPRYHTVNSYLRDSLRLGNLSPRWKGGVVGGLMSLRRAVRHGSPHRLQISFPTTVCECGKRLASR